MAKVNFRHQKRLRELARKERQALRQLRRGGKEVPAAPAQDPTGKP